MTNAYLGLLWMILTFAGSHMQNPLAAAQWNGQGSGTQVATPIFSVAPGAVSPGTLVAVSDATTGATIDYTWDSTTPTYDSTYLFPTGTAMEYRAADYASGFPVYTALTIKAIAHKAGLTDSAVASASYTLVAPNPATQTAVSACGILTTGKTYYLTADLTAAGPCLTIGTSNVIINLNGHTVTGGTGGANLASGTTGTVASNGTGGWKLDDPSASFTTAVNGMRLVIFDGGYHYQETLSVTYTSATEVAISGTPRFTGTVTWYIPPVPTYTIGCYPYNASTGAYQATGGTFPTCNNLQVYNGSVVTSTNGVYGSEPISALSSGGSWVLAGLNLTCAAPQSSCIDIQYTGSGSGHYIGFNKITDNVTSIVDRDLQPFPIRDDTAGGTRGETTAHDNIKDNQILVSPQGGIFMTNSGNVINNYGTLGSVIHYVNGYMVEAENCGITIRGNYVTGDMRGYDLEYSTVTNPTIAQYNISNIQDGTSVHDPSHNPTGTEIDGSYGLRVKPIEPNTSGSLTGISIDTNWLTTTAGAAPAQVLRFTSPEGGTATVTNNVFTLNVSTDQTSALYPSALFSVAGDGGHAPPTGADMTNVTYSGNTLSRTGTYYTTAKDAYIYYDGIANWSVAWPFVPLIEADMGTPNPSSLTFTGPVGTSVMHCNPGGHGAITATYNGATLSCITP